MELKQVTPFLSVSSQLQAADLAELAARGFKSVVNNRPDGEADDQITSQVLSKAAADAGLEYRALPVVPGKISDDDVGEFARLLESLSGPVLAFCRTGTRSITLWALNEARHLELDVIVATAGKLGYDLENLRPRLQERYSQAHQNRKTPQGSRSIQHTYDVVIVGGGAGGLATAASLLRRRQDLDIVVVEPNTHHYYQPGWTMVGAGVFSASQTERKIAAVLPNRVKWLHTAVAGFEPEDNAVVLEDGERLRYRSLVASPGLRLNWHEVDGLVETLGQHGVTSNYSYDTATYTWECVQNLKSGRAVFTQPPMPIKCAGAPQKAMYLSCDYWQRTSRQSDIDVGFYNAGAVLFGVETYVPALMRYVQRYNAHLNFQHNLVAVDGPAGKAWFDVSAEGEEKRRIEVAFDMLHVAPPQGPHRFMKNSPLANEQGWMSVDQQTLQHTQYANIFGLGDGCSAPNAKTAAAVRKQAPVVAENLLAALDGKTLAHEYDGYGSCPLTVERGKVVLAEFGYGGKLLPSFPGWLLNGAKPSRMAWFFKERLLPPIYWELMLRGHEWLAEPQKIQREDLREATP
jgi:sulfide:quinone oxidoreductase